VTRLRRKEDRHVVSLELAEAVIVVATEMTANMNRLSRRLLVNLRNPEVEMLIALLSRLDRETGSGRALIIAPFS
jgi:hypothetical protein